MFSRSSRTLTSSLLLLLISSSIVSLVTGRISDAIHVKRRADGNDRGVCDSYMDRLEPAWSAALARAQATFTALWAVQNSQVDNDRIQGATRSTALLLGNLFGIGLHIVDRKLVAETEADENALAFVYSKSLLNQILVSCLPKQY